ncbi:hypothetical protein [Pseudomonas sp. SDO55104_S430]
MKTDEGFERFKDILTFAAAHDEKIQTEQDSRFNLIDRIVTEVLLWPRSVIQTEVVEGEGRLDYLMSMDDINKLVVEAKNYNDTLLDTRSEKSNYYKYDGPVARTAIPALKQAEGYCLDVGVPFCVVTNGKEWIGHWCIRGDGRKKKDYKILVFPSLQSIQEEFPRFYENFSYEGVLQELYKIYFNDSEGISLYQSEQLYKLRSSSAPSMLNKSPIARDVEKIFSSFFSSMSGDDDPELLINCFVESKESRDTDLSLQKIAKNIVEQIDYIGGQNSHNLAEGIRDAVAREKGDFALIIGNKGAGKSTYIERFFKTTLDAETRERCLVLRIDLRSSSGQISDLVNWLDDTLSNLAEIALFPEGELTYDDLQGVFFREYKRWYQGELKHLYESDKTQFKIEFGKFIQSQRLNEKGKYLNALLWHTIGGRQMMPCLIFDNADHYPKEFQEAVFQYAQSLFRVVNHCFIICPVTDRTIWQLSKNGPFQSYTYKAFYLPTPATKEVLQKRVEFLRQKIKAVSTGPKEQYFLSRGIRVSLQDINAFTACIESIFIDTDYISRLIGSLCNFDIRRTLELTRRTLTSPHIAIDDLVKTYLSQSGRVRIHSSKIKKAIFLGDYNYFSQSDNAFILNVFTIDPSQISTPLAKLSILQVLKQKSVDAQNPETQYMDAYSIATFLEPMGMSRKTTMRHMEDLFSYRLVEPYDPTSEELNETVRLRITSSGLMHIELGTEDLTYCEHVGLASPMRSCEKFDKMREIFSKKLSLEGWELLSKVFIEYINEQDETFCPAAEKLPGQDLIRMPLRRRIA